MDPQLTERLICPRCGPGFGLVLRADEVEAGAVSGGFLGCSNCRALYPVEQSIADLRPQPRSRSRTRGHGVPPPASAGASESDALRLAALIGVAQGPALIALAGSVAGLGSDLAALLSGVEIVALAPRFDFTAPPGASHVLASERLPLRTGSLAGIALAGSWAELLLDEALRCVSPSGRIVLLGASPQMRTRFSQPTPYGAGERARNSGWVPAFSGGAALLPASAAG